MIGKVIEGRYTGASVQKLPDKNVLYIQAEDGTKVALSKKNVISIDDVTDQYPSYGRKVMMVMWNDFETSIIQLGITQQNKSNNRTGTTPIENPRKYNTTENASIMTGGEQNNGIHFQDSKDESHSNIGKHDTANRQIPTTGYAENKNRSIPKQDSIKISNKTGSTVSRPSVGVGYKVVFYFLCVILLFSSVFGKMLFNRTPTEEEISLNQIEAFDALYASLTQENSELNDAERRNLIDSYAKKASLSCYAQDPFNKALVDKYIATYSIEAFVEKLYTIYDEEYFRWDCTVYGGEIKCEYQMFNEMLMYALESNSIEIITTTLPEEGASGFYANYPEKVPESRTSEEKGKFYNSSGENVHYQTRTNTTTGSAHGDFAIRHEVGSSYDSGEYGWKNGVFHDTLPSWKPYNITTYYYKGVYLGQIQLSSTQYFVLGNSTYFMLSPEDCRNDAHSRRKWVKVDVDEEALAEQRKQIEAIKNAALEEIRTFVPEVVMELKLDRFYDAINEPSVWDTLEVTYQEESITDEQFSIDAVYRLKIGMEYLDVIIQLSGDLKEGSFRMTANDVIVSTDEKEAAYATAEALLMEEKNIEAAIAFGCANGYSDATKRSLELWDKILKPEFIGAGSSHVVALNKDGSVVGIGNNNNRAINVSNWTDISTLAVGYHHTAGLTEDGRVVATGSYVFEESDLFPEENIVAISAGYGYTIGLKNDGTVAIANHENFANCDTSYWTNIVAISAGYKHAVGLKADGTVVATGSNDFGERNVSQWTDIIAVSAGLHFTIGLRSDGTVVATGDTEFGQCDVSQWTDIVAISTGAYHAVGLKSDGTVVATKWKGSSKYPGMWYKKQSDVSDWTNIVSISAGWDYTVGLRADGTVVAVGENDYGQCDVNDLKNIQTP